MPISFQLQNLTIEKRIMMQAKKLKTSTNDLLKEDRGRDKILKSKKSRKLPDKSTSHLKSYSKDISRATFLDLTPKKQNHAQKAQNKSVKTYSKSKNLSSCINYSVHERLEKETLPITKRKNSDIAKIDKKMKTKTQEFQMLCRCLTEFAKEERRAGKNPNNQIIKLIKAFNSSQISSCSKEFKNYVKCILEFIEVTIVDSQPQSFGNTYISKDQVSYSKNLQTNPQKTQMKDNREINRNVTTAKKLDFSPKKQDSSSDSLSKKSVGQEMKNQMEHISDKLNELQITQEKLQKEMQNKFKDKLYLQQIVKQQQQALQDLEHYSNRLKSSKSYVDSEEDSSQPEENDYVFRQ